MRSTTISPLHRVRTRSMLAALSAPDTTGSGASTAIAASITAVGSSTTTNFTTEAAEIMDTGGNSTGRSISSTAKRSPAKRRRLSPQALTMNTTTNIMADQDIPIEAEHHIGKREPPSQEISAATIPMVCVESLCNREVAIRGNSPLHIRQSHASSSHSVADIKLDTISDVKSDMLTDTSLISHADVFSIPPAPGVLLLSADITTAGCHLTPDDMPPIKDPFMQTPSASFEDHHTIINTKSSSKPIIDIPICDLPASQEYTSDMAVQSSPSLSIPSDFERSLNCFNSSGAAHIHIASPSTSLPLPTSTTVIPLATTPEVDTVVTVPETPTPVKTVQETAPNSRQNCTLEPICLDLTLAPYPQSHLTPPQEYIVSSPHPSLRSTEEDVLEIQPIYLKQDPSCHPSTLGDFSQPTSAEASGLAEFQTLIPSTLSVNASTVTTTTSTTTPPRSSLEPPDNIVTTSTDSSSVISLFPPSSPSSADSLTSIPSRCAVSAIVVDCTGDDLLGPSHEIVDLTDDSIPWQSNVSISQQDAISCTHHIEATVSPSSFVSRPLRPRGLPSTQYSPDDIEIVRVVEPPPHVAASTSNMFTVQDNTDYMQQPAGVWGPYIQISQSARTAGLLPYEIGARNDQFLEPFDSDLLGPSSTSLIDFTDISNNRRVQIRCPPQVSSTYPDGSTVYTGSIAGSTQSIPNSRGMQPQSSQAIVRQPNAPYHRYLPRYTEYPQQQNPSVQSTQISSIIIPSPEPPAPPASLKCAVCLTLAGPTTALSSTVCGHIFCESNQTHETWKSANRAASARLSCLVPIDSCSTVPVQPTTGPDLLRHLRLHRGAKYIHSPHSDQVHSDPESPHVCKVFIRADEYVCHLLHFLLHRSNESESLAKTPNIHTKN
ncbi:hypothetical protein BASA83_012374 [Batrachochytrium salamandrivorans]|nr:hypothetical protein BASA83_012374 [Batrachochytrium salamandrivorans]